MSQFLMLCTSTFVVVSGWAANVPEDFRFVPAKIGETPSCARDGQTYCEHAESYPEQTILRLLKTAPPEFTELLFEENLNKGVDRYGSSSEIQNSSMVGEDLLEEQLCRSKWHIIRPRAVRNLNNEWRYIVNVPGYHQKKEFETCTKQGETCSSYIQPNVSARCLQKHILTSLLALQPSGEKLYIENTMYNACCQCTLFNIN